MNSNHRSWVGPYHVILPTRIPKSLQFHLMCPWKEFVVKVRELNLINSLVITSKQVDGQMCAIRRRLHKIKRLVKSVER
jgi:hypothetical protein